MRRVAAVVVCLAVILMVAYMALGLPAHPKRTAAQRTAEVDASGIEQHSLDHPLVFDSGFQPTTGALVVCFGTKVPYDSLDEYHDTLDRKWSIFIHRNRVDSTGYLDSASIYNLYRDGHEIGNAGVDLGDSNWVSYCGPDRLDKIITDTYTYLVDTLDISCYGYNFGKDYTPLGVLKAAANHQYGITLDIFDSPAYEADTTTARFSEGALGFPVADSYRRYTGQYIGKYLDTLKVESSTFYTSDLIQPNSITNHWKIPVGFYYLSNSDTNVDSLEIFQGMVHFAMRSRSLAIFMVEEWDTNATWLGTALTWADSLVDAGDLSMPLMKDAVKDWVLRPVASGYNFLPWPPDSSWGTRPAGWMYTAMPESSENYTGSGTNAFTWYYKDDGKGLGYLAANRAGEYVEVAPPTKQGVKLMSALAVPGNCWVHFGVCANAESSFNTLTDSLKMVVQLQPADPQYSGYAWMDTTGVDSIQGLRYVRSQVDYDSTQAEAHKYVLDVSGALGAFSEISGTGTLDYPAQARWLRGNRDRWLWITHDIYVDDPKVVLALLGFTDAAGALPAWRSGRGIKIGYWYLYFTRRYGAQMPTAW
jgi:hypothetical protein